MSAGVRVLPANALEADWLAARRTGIGASEIAAVAGLSRRRGPWDVWSSKVDGTELEPTDAMRWGQFIEGRIVDWWAEETGRHVGPGGLFRHPVHDWLIATPDALAYTAPTQMLVSFEPPEGWSIDYGNEVTAVVDAKNAGWHMGGDWDEDGAPVEYIAQITWQMLAVGVNEGYLVAAIGGKPPTERHFTLDDDLAGELIRRGHEFWKLVQHRTPPPVDGSAPASRWVTARYPDAGPDAVVELNDMDVDLLAGWVALDARIAELETAKKAAENVIKDHLGQASTGLYKGQPYVTWRQIERAGYTVRPTTYRRFDIPKAVRRELGGEVGRG